MGQTFITPAVVLRRVDYRDADRIITLFTRDLGRIAGVARGVRRSVKRFTGRLDLFTLVQVQCRESGALYRLESSSLMAPHLGIREDLLRIAWAGSLSEWMERLFGEGEPHPEAFFTLTRALDYLSRAPAVQEGVMHALSLRLLMAAGLQPELDACVNCRIPVSELDSFQFVVTRGGPLCEACSRADSGIVVSVRALSILGNALSLPLDRVEEVRLTEGESREIREMLTSFVQYHVGSTLRASSFLAEMLCRAY